MNTSQGALYFGAGIDRTQWNRDVEAMRRDIAGLSQTAATETQKMDSYFKNLSLGIAGYFSVGAIKGFVTELINVRGEFQKTEIAFSTMLGSAVKAAQLMDQMVVLAAKTPFSLQEVSSGAKQLLAFQVPANEVVDTLTRLGNIAAGLSVPLSRINLVYGQVKAKGRLMGDDLRQFTEAGIPMVAELASKFGKTEAEITAMVSAGKIGFKDVKDVLFSLTNEGGMFFNLMQKQSASVSGQIANLGDAWDQMLNQIGQSNEGLIYDSIAGLATLVENYQEVIKVLQVLIITYGAYRAAIIATAALQGQLVAPAVIQGLRNLITLLRGATVAQTALNTASLANPYILLATAIAGIVAIMITYRQEINDLMTDYKGLEQQIKYNEQVQEKYSSTFSKGIVENREKIVSLIAVINSENSKLEDRKRAYEKLIKIDDSFRGALDAQYRATFKLGDAFDYVIGKMQKFALVQAEMAVKSEYLKQNAEDEFNLSIAQVKYQEAERNIKKYAQQLQKGIIDIKQYSILVKPYEEVAQTLLKSQKAVKESRKDVDYVNQAEKQKLDTLRKQERILNSQLTGGKVQGKSMTDQQRVVWQRKLKDIQEEIKLRLGNTIEEVTKENPSSEGYVEKIEAKIDELKAAYKKALTPEAARAINVEIAKWQAKLDALNPKKDKKDKQLAEVLPLGSVKELQQRANLIQEAIDTAVNGVVKLRKLDKYGKDKDKNGNPFLTGEVVSAEEAGKRLEQINEQIKNKQYKSFQERIDESERQWNNYYKMSEFYGKETADAQYKDLFQGSQSYLSFLEKQEQALKDLAAKGMLSDKQKQDLVFLQTKIRELDGTETPLENFKRGLENALKSIPSLVDQLNYLDAAEQSVYQKEGYNSKPFLDSKKYIQDQKKQILQQLQDIYQEFLNEQKSFEEKKLEVEQKYNDIRKKIGENKTLTDAERLKLLGKITKNENEEISNLSLEAFKKTDLWVKAFGDLSKIGPRTLENLKKGLEDYLKSDDGKKLKASDLKETQDQITKLNDLINSNNPYKAIGTAVDIYKKKRQELNEVEKKSGKNSAEYKYKLEETQQAFVNIVEVTGAAAKATIEVVGTIGDAFGGLSDELKQTLAEVQQLIDGIVNTVTGYFSGNYGQMISGIVQIVGAMVKLLSGDKARERQIKEWQRAVEDLKTSYDELQRSIERTAGEASLAMNRALIENLQEQKRLLTQMREEENAKKKADQDKITSFNSQISQINQQIESVMDSFKKSVTTTDFKDLSQKLADALIEAFGKGEDAAQSFDKVVEDVMKNAVANALRIKILEPAVQKMVDSLYSSMGYGNGNPNTNNSQIAKYQADIAELEKKIKAKESQTYSPELAKEVLELKAQKQKLLDLIGALQAQASSTPLGGNFDGLTQEERDKIKSMGTTAMQQYMAALEEYKDLFGQSAENAQGLKGDIKGMTEKTAGALEAQFNAIRINVVEMLKLMQGNKTLENAKINLLSQIEVNTRNLVQIRKDMAELNSKVKYGAAGIP